MSTSVRPAHEPDGGSPSGGRIRRATGSLPTTPTIPLAHTGEFDLSLSLQVAGRALFVERVAPSTEHLDLALAVEGSWSPVAVRIVQDGDDLHAQVHANPDNAPDSDIAAQLRRMLALVPDGTGLAVIAARDDVAASLVERFPGLRPISYPSPYEAAARAIIGHRLALPAAAVASRRVAEAAGVALDIDGQRVLMFPQPERLAELSSTRGLSDRKVDQLRTLGREAADGSFSSQRLSALPYEEAMDLLQTLPGIGPFSAELVMIRGLGHPDVLPRTEGRLHRAIAELYDLGPDPDVAALEGVADRWSPLRSWIGLMARQSTLDRSTGSATTPRQRQAA